MNMLGEQYEGSISEMMQQQNVSDSCLLQQNVSDSCLLQRALSVKDENRTFIGSSKMLS